jgi:FkbM family methyltransferase
VFSSAAISLPPGQICKIFHAMQTNPYQATQWERRLDYFTILGFALKHCNSLSASASLYYLAKLKGGLVFRGLARFDPAKIRRVPFRVAAGKTWDIYLRDNGHDASLLVQFFKHGTLLEVERQSCKPQVIYDLGANIGIASLALAALCPEAHIYGFEPAPANFEICSLNYSNLAKAQAFNCAVGSFTGTMNFELSSDPEAGRLTANADGGGPNSDKGIEVEVWTVSALVETKGLLPPDFLKVDVEGAEFDVLNGLGVHAKGVKQIHLETHSIELKDKCVRWLSSNGFTIEKELRYNAVQGALWAKRTADC